MPARTDHERRDAQSRVRHEIAVKLERYKRRLLEEAYAHIEEEAAKHDGITFRDWDEVGKAAADRALSSWGFGADPQPAIDADAAVAIEAGADPAPEP